MLELEPTPWREQPGRIGAFRITPRWPARRVQVALFVLPSLAAGNTITMQAYRTGAPRASHSVLIPASGSHVRTVLDVSAFGIEAPRQSNRRGVIP